MSELSKAQQELLAVRLGRAPTRASGPEPIPSVEGSPLTSGQEALWFEIQRDPESARYGVTTELLIDGDLDPGRFGDALRRVAALHEPLHTSFTTDRTIIPVDRAIEITVVNGDEARLRQQGSEQAKERLDPRHGPLIRVLLMDLGNERWGVVLTMHHLWSDSASVELLLRQVDAVYRGLELSEPETTYSSHGRWQAARISESDVASASASIGKAVAPDLGLPRPRNVAAGVGGYLQRPLAHRGSADFAVSPLTTAIAAMAVATNAHTDEPAIVSIAMSTRDHPAVQDLVGYFLNSVPVVLPNAADFAPDGTITDALLEESAVVAAAALSRRTVPYAAIVQERRRHGQFADLADVMLVLHDESTYSFDGHEVTARTVPNGTAVAPLTVFVRPGHHVAVEYATDAYRPADLEAFLERLQAVLQGESVHSFSEDTHVGGALPPTSSTSVIELIATQGARHGDSPALRSLLPGLANGTVSYAQLTERIETMAASLAAKGIGRGSRVAVRLPRGVEQVLTVLGVLRSGAAYVPIDVSLPQRRVEQMLRLVPPDLMLEEGFAANALIESAKSGASLPPVPLPEDEAYIIFTSGSTGAPKAVGVKHKELLSSTIARGPVYGAVPERFLWTSGFGFDSSVVGLFWTLTSGGELILPCEEQATDVDALVELIRSTAASHILTVPSLYSALLRRGGGRLESIRVAIVAGETCPAELITRHHQTLPMCAFWNEYGPTETTVWATVHRCLPEDTDPVPIGLTIPGVKTRVVGTKSDITRPIGSAGELMIGGSGVTAGYLDADSTPDPEGGFVEWNGERWYRTGDRVRRRHDGSLEFLGRTDSQLNINGVRLEPEGAEQILLELRDVTAAIVRAEPGPMGRLQLVSHVETADGSLLTEAQIRIHLTRALPTQAVPQRIYLHNELPRTHNGKVDRSAPLKPRSASLSLSDVGTAETGVTSTGFTSADGGMLDSLVELWRLHSGSDVADPESDFFAIGGDSLGSIELAFAIETFLRKHGSAEGPAESAVPVSTILSHRTPRRVSNELLKPPTSSSQPLGQWCTQLRSEGSNAPLFLFAPGDGRLTAYQPLVDQLNPSYPIFGFTLPGTDRRGKPLRTIEAHTDAFLDDIVTQAQGRPVRLMGMSTGGLLAFDAALRMEAMGHPVELTVMVDTVFPAQQQLADSQSTDWAERFRSASATARVEVAVRRGGNPRPGLTDRSMRRATQRAVSRYQPSPLEAPVLFVAASSTSRSLTVDHWKPLIKNLTVEQLAGAHTGEGGLMKAGRVGSVAVAVDRNLR